MARFHTTISKYYMYNSGRVGTTLFTATYNYMYTHRDSCVKCSHLHFDLRMWTLYSFNHQSYYYNYCHLFILILKKNFFKMCCCLSNKQRIHRCHHPIFFLVRSSSQGTVTTIKSTSQGTIAYLLHSQVIYKPWIHMSVIIIQGFI